MSRSTFLIRLREAPLLKAVAVALLITAVLGVLSAKSPLFSSIEHWTSDWRTAILAETPPAQHPAIAVVMIDDQTLAGLPYRSPIDRALLADLIKAIDEAGAAIIGLDFIFDQPTEPEKDARLVEALKAANGQIVLGALDERTRLEEPRLAYNRKFLADTGARSGLLNIRIEMDGTVRSLPARVPGAPPYFAGAIAETAGASVPDQGLRRIAWLGHPANEDVFLRIPAHSLLPGSGGENSALRNRLRSALSGRIVLVGAELSDGADKFMTPLSQFDNRPMPGVLIHAHAVAQFLDGRSYVELGRSATLCLVAVTALFGFLLGWRFHQSGALLGLPPIIAYLGADIIVFWFFSVILPFALPALAWLLGVFSGKGARWLSERAARAGAKTEQGI